MPQPGYRPGNWRGFVAIICSIIFPAELFAATPASLRRRAAHERPAMAPITNQTTQSATTATAVASDELVTVTSGGRHADLPAGTPPELVSSSSSGTAAHATITLNFNTAMAIGSGMIYVTDGAAQTVIDRATGLPAMRIVGATDTHAIPAGSVHVSGTQVTIDATGLQAGLSYSVLMDAGVLVTASHRVFGGLHGANGVVFAPAASDTQGPALTAITLDGPTLSVGHDIGVTLTFSEPVALLPGAVIAPNATIGNLHATGDGRTWSATLSGAANTTSAANTLSVDMSLVHDGAGNAGSGPNSTGASYQVDTVAPATPAAIVLDVGALTGSHGIGFSITFAEAVTLDASAFTTPHASISGLHAFDGGRTWAGTLATGETGTSSGNKISLDMTRVLDLAGNHGSGTVASAGYAVNPSVFGATISLDHTTLRAGSDIGVTIAFSEKVTGLPAVALTAGHALVSDITTDDDGLTWHATLSASDSVTASGNVLALDLSRVQAADGSGGSGIVSSPAYVVDTLVGAWVSWLSIDDEGPYYDDGVTNVDVQNAYGVIAGPMNSNQQLELVINNETIAPARIEVHSLEGVLWWYFGSDADDDSDSPADKFHEGQNTITARIVDNTGHASAQVSKTFIVDTVAPHIATAPASEPGLDPAQQLVITFDEPVWFDDGESYDDGIEVVDKFGSSYWIPVYESNFSGDHKTLAIDASQHQLSGGNKYKLYLNNFTDLAGNGLEDGPVTIYTSGEYVDTGRPFSQTALVMNGSGSYRAGETLELRVRFNENVHVVGAAHPELGLSNGAHAQYVSASGKDLVFHYTIADGDDASGLQITDAYSLVDHVADDAGNLMHDTYVEYDGFRDGDGYGAWIEIDTRAPAKPSAPALDAASDSGVSHTDNVTNQRSPYFKGTGAEYGTTIELYEGATRVGVGYGYSGGEDTSGKWSAWLNGQLSEGTHTLTVRQVDQAGNASAASAPLVFRVDTTAAAPSAPSLALGSDSGASGSDNITNVTKPTFTGTGAEPGSTVTLYANGQEVGHAVSNASGGWTIPVLDALLDNVYTFKVAQEDIAGNVSGYSASTTVTIDTTAPVVAHAEALGLARTYSLEFSERIVFAPGGQFTATAGSLELGTYQPGGSNWEILNNEHGEPTVMQFHIGVTGLIHMQANTGSIQDLAGNAAIIGSVDFVLGVLS
jgi:hypothetical protein